MISFLHPVNLVKPFLGSRMVSMIKITWNLGSRTAVYDRYGWALIIDWNYFMKILKCIIKIKNIADWTVISRLLQFAQSSTPSSNQFHLIVTYNIVIPYFLWTSALENRERLLAVEIDTRSCIV